MVCFTAQGEPLWVKQRPGNAAANDISDHLEVIDAAVSVLPEADAAGHRGGDYEALVRRRLVVRIDGRCQVFCVRRGGGHVRRVGVAVGIGWRAG